MVYEPATYWQERGKAYTHKEGVGELDRLADWIREFRPMNILEVGAGTGRVYAHLRDKGVVKPDRYAMCDFVDSFRTACQAATGILPDAWDGKRLPYADGSFELVVSVSVMLHVPPAEIAAFLAEHVRVAWQHLFVATWYQGGRAPQGREHNFEHDYPALFKAAKLKVVRGIPCGERGKLDRMNWLLRKTQ